MHPHFRYLVTCEHASPAIPPEWREKLEPYCATCETHRIWDPGALEIANHLGNRLQAPVLPGEQTRLLVDLNRSVGHPRLFAPVLDDLPETVKTGILTKYYYPYRHRAVHLLEQWMTERTPVIHLSVHSFTPVLDGIPRKTDFGLLYDTNHRAERALAQIWINHLRNAAPDLICRENHPYAGASDGHCTSLRRCHGRAMNYLGFELEFNQGLPLAEKAEAYAKWIFRTLQQSVGSKRLESLIP